MIRRLILLSTTEVEYVALAEVAKENIWLEGLFIECDFILDRLTSKVRFIWPRILNFILDLNTFIILPES